MRQDDLGSRGKQYVHNSGFITFSKTSTSSFHSFNGKHYILVERALIINLLFVKFVHGKAYFFNETSSAGL